MSIPLTEPCTRKGCGHRFGMHGVAEPAKCCTPGCKCKAYMNVYPCVSEHGAYRTCSGCEHRAELSGYQPEEEAPSDVGMEPVPNIDKVIEWPPHYNQGKIQMTDYVLDQKLGWCSANVVKYVVRSRHKGKRLEDLKKALWYLQKLIARIESGGEE